MQKQLGILFFLSLLISCASPGIPGGGPIDSDPPVVTKTVPSNKSVNLKPYIITVDFDEYIVLKDLQNQLIISPLIEPKPLIKVKNKTLSIDMSKCNLKENTTYVMNFGNSVVDFTEGNPIRGYTYVFSTGSFIDSLSISGTALDAFNLEKKEGTSIELYRDLSDTAIYSLKPDYIAKTDVDGHFTLSYLAPGKYRIYVVDDANKNYLLNKDEKVGYLSSVINLETSIENIELRYFSPEPKLVIKEAKQVSKGVFKFIFNKSVEKDLVEITCNGTSRNKRTINYIKHFTEGDSLYFYTPDLLFNDKDSANFSLEFRDTTYNVLVKIDNDLSVHPLNITLIENRISPYDSLIFESSSPIRRMGEDQVRLIDLTDTIEVGTFAVEQVFKDQFFFYIKSNWKEGHQYRVVLLDSMVVDQYNQYKGLKPDTLLDQKFRIKTEEETGTLNLKLILPKLNSLLLGDSLNDYHVSSANYIVQLVDSRDNIELEFYIDNKTKTEHNISLKYLAAKEYRIKIIKEDDIPNHRWDIGSLKTFTQPEMVFYYPKKLNVRANWEIDGIIINLPSQ